MTKYNAVGTKTANLSLREALEQACQELIQKNIPITRKALAEIVGCTPRTVSSYKDVWRRFAPEVNVSEGERVVLSPREYQQSTFVERLEALNSRAVDTLTEEQLIGSISTVRFWRGSVDGVEFRKSCLEVEAKLFEELKRRNSK